MPDRIYVVDSAAEQPTKVESVSFRDIGVTERDDLQRWVAKDPCLLGEPLLFITSEFGKFDKSNRRLDILALDVNACLVVVELKLDASKTLADQQAIRYAAMCSKMTMEDVVDALAKADETDREQAARKICDFLRVNTLPEISCRPRIILAAGSIQDRELTNCVLWLRDFGMDISCVEIKPYRPSDSRQVILVPRTVIPMPEIADYRVGISRPQSKTLGGKSARSAFWRSVADEFNKLETGLHASGKTSRTHMCLRFGDPKIHYEWIVRRRQHRLDVSLHFEFDDREESMRWLEIIRQHQSSIAKDIDLEFETVPWGRKWSEARFRIQYEGSFPGDGSTHMAAQTMRALIYRTWPLIVVKQREETHKNRKKLSEVSMALLDATNRLGREIRSRRVINK